MTTLQETQNRIAVPIIPKKELQVQNKELVEENTYTKTRAGESVISSVDKIIKTEEIADNNINSFEILEKQEQEVKTEERKCKTKEKELSAKNELKLKDEIKSDGYDEFLDKLYNKGSLALSNTLMQGLSIVGELVFSRLRTEEQYAIEKKHLTKNGMFPIDVDEIHYHLGLPHELIENIIINLVERKLVDISEINDYNCIKTNKENTLRFLNSLENDEPEYNQYKKLSAVYKQALKENKPKEQK